MLAEMLKNTITPHIHRLCNICELSLTRDEKTWCKCCRQHFLFPPHCLCCGLPLLTTQDRCGECLTRPPYWQRLYCLGDYTYPLSQEVQLIKYRGQRWRLPRLVELLTPTIDDKPDLITSVPLHWRRQWRRGFNQSDLMAKQIASQLNVPYLPTWFKRNRSTPYQRGLNNQQRQTNVRHAFTLRHSLSPPVGHVAICDDVVTTGSTVNQLCQLLLDVGVKRVDIYCLCRTSSDCMD